MSSKTKLVLESMVIAAVLTTVDIAVSFLVLLFDATLSILSIVSTVLFTEFAIMLVIGGCMMAREPLDDDKKYDSEGNPVTAWKMTLIGRKILLGALFVFAFSFLFYAIDLVI